MPNQIRRAISIRQPYVELILQGKKLKEFRSRRTLIRERVYIYASLTPRNDPSAWKAAGQSADALPTGCIVGSVEIVDCVDDRRNGFAYLLSNPRRLRSFLSPTNQPQPGFWLPQF